MIQSYTRTLEHDPSAGVASLLETTEREIEAETDSTHLDVGQRNHVRSRLRVQQLKRFPLAVSGD